VSTPRLRVVAGETRRVDLAAHARAVCPDHLPNDEGSDELVVVRDIPFRSLCMHHLWLRGAQKAGARTVTSALHGLVRDDPRTRQEFLSLTGGRTR